MTTHLYRVDGPDGPRFRLWQNTADAWCCDPLTAEEMAAHLAVCWPDRPGWLERAEVVPAWWLGGMESDCSIFGHQEPDGDRCWWCGHALYDVLGPRD